MRLQIQCGSPKAASSNMASAMIAAVVIGALPFRMVNTWVVQPDYR
jgi:hypothetical protein